MKPDNLPQVTRFWNNIANEFDAIYTGEKSGVGRMLDRWLRKDIYQRFDWVMEKAGDVSGKTVCDIGWPAGIRTLSAGFRPAPLPFPCGN